MDPSVWSTLIKQFSKSTANPPAVCRTRTEHLQGCYELLYVYEKDTLHLQPEIQKSDSSTNIHEQNTTAWEIIYSQPFLYALQKWKVFEIIYSN